MAKKRARDQLAVALVQQEAHLRGERATSEALWQNVAELVIPRRASFQEEVVPGVERNRKILDSTAARSLELFASFIHTLLNNPSVTWIKIGVSSAPELNDRMLVRKWLEASGDIIMTDLAGPQANIYSHLHQVYLDLGAFGTAVLFLDAGPDGRLRVRYHHLAKAVMAENAFGIIDTLHLTETFTPRQAQQKWPGLDLGKSVEKAKGKDVHKPLRFIHSVFPNTDAVAGLLPARVRLSGAPFASSWTNAADNITIQTGAFEEFPYITPRWYKSRGEIYGRSPAMTVLPDIRMVNTMSDTILRGAEKIVDPPLLLPDGSLISPVRMFSGGITFSDGAVKPESLIPPGTARIEVGNDLLQRRQEAIREGFFVPLFATPESPVKTATQVLQEADERNRAVSPMLVRTQEELHQKLATRSFNILDRQGRLPPMPPALQGHTLKIEFVSPLTASQKETEGLSTMRLFEAMAAWAQFDAGIFDGVDIDVVRDILHQATGAPAKLARSRADIERLRGARQETQQNVERQQQLVEGAEVLAKLQTAQRPKK